MDQKLELNIVPRTKVSLQEALLPGQSFPGPKPCYVLMGLLDPVTAICALSLGFSALFFGGGGRFQLMV